MSELTPLYSCRRRAAGGGRQAAGGGRRAAGGGRRAAPTTVCRNARNSLKFARYCVGGGAHVVWYPQKTS